MKVRSLGASAAAMLFVSALVAGCGSDKAEQAATRAEDAARRAESAASRVEAAAQRAEAAAEKAERLFSKHMHK
jgi:outer membrane murein-binding lipoprotein Lpp